LVAAVDEGHQLRVLSDFFDDLLAFVYAVYRRLCGSTHNEWTSRVVAGKDRWLTDGGTRGTAGRAHPARRSALIHSKRRIFGIVAAVFIGLPVAVFADFSACVFLDMHQVEASAGQCKVLISAIYKLKNRTGRFPDNDEANGIDAKLRTHCHYSSSGDQFSMGLTGSWINMQAYVFSSEANRWY
jgi:hypothetical protein